MNARKYLEIIYEWKAKVYKFAPGAGKLYTSADFIFPLHSPRAVWKLSNENCLP